MARTRMERRVGYPLRMARLVACIALAVVAVGCPSLAPDDASALDAPGLDVGETCTDPDGYTHCGGTGGTTCCDGHLRRFIDSPCLRAIDAAIRVDAGGADAGDRCDVASARVDCPCSTEGEIDCSRGALGWRLECQGGTWQEHRGFVCC